MSEQPLQARRVGDDLVVCRRLVTGESFLQRFLGLMGRASLPEGEGLWLPTSSIHMLFMRFAIDALFLGPSDSDGGRRVVALRPQLPPWRGIVLPVRGARGVIEMPAGSLARQGVAAGDVIVFEPVPDAPDKPGVDPT